MLRAMVRIRVMRGWERRGGEAWVSWGGRGIVRVTVVVTLGVRVGFIIRVC